MKLLRYPLFCFILLLASVAQARVISYAPYTDRTAVPALGHRLNRHFILIEQTTITSPGSTIRGAQAVLYDAYGDEEPRVVFPTSGGVANILASAVREDANGVAILLHTAEVSNNQTVYKFYLSTDGGRTWNTTPLPNVALHNGVSNSADTGGPFARSKYAQIRIGNSQFPFVLSLPTKGLWAVGSDASARMLLDADGDPMTGWAPRVLMGSDREGTRFILRHATDRFSVIDLGGNRYTAGAIDPGYNYEGWITPEGGVYLEAQTYGGGQLSYYRNGVRTDIAGPPPGSAPPPVLTTPPIAFTLSLFAIPSADYASAWYIERGQGKPTKLFRHVPGSAPVLQWEDITAPEVEALHAGAAGDKLLIQVHRPRQQADQRLFQDPALAVWKIGDPAPRVYDELFMNEQYTKGFVYVNVDRLNQGEPFVFDSGTYGYSDIIVSPPMSPPVGGGSDVVQEWGVVRASLHQRLVLSGIGRVPGAFGSFWKSDVIIHNPLSVPQGVVVRWVPNGQSTSAANVQEKVVTLRANEIRLISDALKTIFGIDSGNGAFFLTPDAGVSATARTYTESSKGSYGFAMNAVDFYAAAASPRFPVSFSGAFPGPNFRTNVVLTDTSGRGTDSALRASGSSGAMGSANVTLQVPSGGQQQLNFVGLALGLAAHETGALVIHPTAGTAIASAIAIDNITNDPTHFAPDLPSPIVRTIPGIAHVTGANNANFRSDLYLYNPASTVRTVTLQASMWDGSAPMTLNLTMLGGEARVIRDVLATAFNRTGIARLRYTSASDPLGVRVTSRTYSVEENGGTYGFLMPPLNNFQTAGGGDTLELLGAVIDPKFRVNIGLVDLTAFSTGRPSSVRIDIHGSEGAKIDSFVISVPSAGGLQLNDIATARSLGAEQGPVMIRVSPETGMIGAYVVMVDNGTNDSTYYASNLAAKQ